MKQINSSIIFSSQFWCHLLWKVFHDFSRMAFIPGILVVQYESLYRNVLLYVDLKLLACISTSPLDSEDCED